MAAKKTPNEGRAVVAPDPPQANVVEVFTCHDGNCEAYDVPLHMLPADGWEDAIAALKLAIDNTEAAERERRVVAVGRIYRGADVRLVLP